MFKFYDRSFECYLQHGSSYFYYQNKDLNSFGMRNELVLENNKL